MVRHNRRRRQERRYDHDQYSPHLSLRSMDLYSHLPIVLPSANLAPTKLPAWLPSRIGLMRMLTAAPGVKVVLRQPLRESEFGLPPSTLHSSLAPAGFCRSTWIQMCGFVHWNSLTVPVSSTVF